MKYILTILILTLFGCIDKAQPKQNVIESKPFKIGLNQDSSKTVVIEKMNTLSNPNVKVNEAIDEFVKADDYKIDFNMISNNLSQNSNPNIERAYFLSEDKTQFIEIRLATDYHKEKIFHYSIVEP